jgi:hypothetical protein
LLAGRRKFVLLVPLLAALLLVATTEALQLINGPSVDMMFSGAITGHITELSAWQGQGATCSVGKVYTTRQWDGELVGTLDGKRVVLNIALTPYQGAATYSNAGIPDAQTLARLTPPQLYQVKIPVHMLLSSMPAGARDGTRYATEPDPAVRPTSTEELAKLAGLGKATVTLNPDQKSGRIQANLMNAKIPTSASVRVDGSFRCRAVEARVNPRG